MLHNIKEHCVGPDKFYEEVDFGAITGNYTVGDELVLQYSQEDLEFDINGLKISGHVDGWAKRNGEWVIIECKSSSNLGFKKFQDFGPTDYLQQAHALMLTDKAQDLGVTEVHFYYLRKETGHIWMRSVSYDHKIAKRVKSGFLAAASEEAPRPEYGFIEETFRKKPTGRWTIPWQCGYCPYKDECKPGGEVEFKSGKPKFIYKEENVYEV